MDENEELFEQEAPAEQADAAAKEVAEAENRRAHEEAEAKRKAEWEAKQQAKKETEQKALDELAAMSDEDVTGASIQRTGEAIERLTRRNMKHCVAEHVQALCRSDPAFARLTMHPRKSMIHCFWYINRKARAYLEQEMQDNDEKPQGGGFGGDVPDDLCLAWAVEYFRDPDAQEDAEKEEKFVPKPYPGGGSKPKKKEQKPKPEPKKPPAPPQLETEQLSLFGGEMMAVA